MRLTRLYIPDTELASGLTIPLSEEHSHYLVRVLRNETGHGVILFNGHSGAWQGTLVVTGKRAAALLEKQIQKPQPVSDIWLLASPLKKEAWDFVVEKSTELGAAVLQPILMEFTQTHRVNDDRIRANQIEATQQCERTDVPAFFKAEKLETVLKGWDRSRVLYAAVERSDAKPALDVYNKTKPGAILIGPEGGFSPREKEVLAKYDFVKPISLGPLILRAETAALVALALWVPDRQK